MGEGGWTIKELQPNIFCHLLRETVLWRQWPCSVPFKNVSHSDLWTRFPFVTVTAHLTSDDTRLFFSLFKNVHSLNLYRCTYLYIKGRTWRNKLSKRIPYFWNHRTNWGSLCEEKCGNKTHRFWREGVIFFFPQLVSLYYVKVHVKNFPYKRTLILFRLQFYGILHGYIYDGMPKMLGY